MHPAFKLLFFISFIIFLVVFTQSGTLNHFTFVSDNEGLGIKFEIKGCLFRFFVSTSGQVIITVAHLPLM